MKIERTDLPGVMIFTPDVYEDNRGYLKEPLNKYHQFKPAQVIQSVSKKGVVRGLHNQAGTAKLVWVAKGSIFDVAFDPKIGDYVGVELTADNHEQLYVPGHMYHGFQALEDNTVVCYLLDKFYDPKGEHGYNPEFVDWPIEERIISEKDKRADKFHN